MPRTPDTYSAAQAAQILGVSERRVRQLVKEGKLAGERGTDGQVHIAQQAVNEERKRRRTNGPAAAAADGTKTRAARGTRAAATAAMDVDQLADRVATAVGQRLEGQLEITRQAESSVRAALDEERARRMEAEAKLEAAQARLVQLEAVQAEQAAKAERRGLFRRRA